MSTFFLLSCITLLAYCVSSEVADVDQDLVDHYVNFINTRTEKVQNFQLPTDARMHEPENKTIEDYGEFDFIVIGAGSTGCIIANRLSEVSTWKVLLLEAGTFPDDDFTRIPSLHTSNVLTKFNWAYQTTPQKYICLENPGAVCALPNGKGIGGTSLMNSMLYSRGNKLDYKMWADLLHDDSYRYERLLPYFLKTENFTQTSFESPIDWKYHGTKGLLHVTHSISPSEVQNAIFQGSKQLGFPIIDYNGKEQIGTSAIQYYLNNGFRDDPGRAFISTAGNRTNLIVSEGSYVMKLNICAETKRINGVIFSKDNKTFIARSRKEVILSAGAIGSPKILMLSGIGPEDHLRTVGIPTIENLPVGSTLNDHVLSILQFSINSSFTNISTETQVKELLQGKGPLTSSVTSNTVVWLKIPNEGYKDNPDGELLFSNTFDMSTNSSSFSCYVMPTHPVSKGTIRLKSADPFEYPLINGNHLSDDRDMELLYNGFKIVLQLVETEAFRKINTTLAPIDPDECNQAPPLTKEFWFCYLKRRAMPGQHLLSTCLTGTSPRNGVVDKDLKVFGIRDLRVADASVIPFPFSNHPTGTLAVIAEKISDQIKIDHIKVEL